MHSARLRSLIPLSLLAAAACGGAPPTAVTGTVQGRSLAASEASAFTGDQIGAGMTEAIIVIDNQAGPLGTTLMCSDLKTGRQPMSGTFLMLTLVQTDANGVFMPPTSGDYTIFAGESPGPSARIAAAQFLVMGQSQQTLTAQATAGTVHVSDVKLEAGGSVEGTFDLTLNDDHLSGTMNAPFCDEMSPNQRVPTSTMASPPPEEFDGGPPEFDAGLIGPDAG